MTTTVTWSSNLQTAVKQGKSVKTITSGSVFHNQALAEIEELIVQKQLMKDTKEIKEAGFWA